MTKAQTQGILAIVQPLQVNPQTGFLESHSVNRRSFDSEKKMKVIELVRQCAQQGKWPRLSTISDIVDVGITTIRDHLATDGDFKMAYEEAMAPVEDNLVDNLVQQGKNANGITANIFLLKTRWPERWGEKNQIFSVDFATLKGVFGRSSTVFDADIVDKPADTPKLPASKDGPNGL